MDSAEHEVTEARPDVTRAAKASVSQEAVMSWRFLGTVSLFIAAIQGYGVVPKGRLPPHTMLGAILGAILRAKRTQWSMGLGSVKYMTPPSFAPSGGITLRPWASKTPTTSSTS